MKKTFKGYSALIALLIALLVVTAMPVVSFAADPEPATDPQEIQVGKELHRVYKSREIKVPTCGEDGLDEYICLGSYDKDGNRIGDCGYGGKHILANTDRPAHKEYVKSQTGSDCTKGGEVEVWCSVCKQHIRTDKLETASHSFNDAEFAFYSLDKDGNEIKGNTYLKRVHTGIYEDEDGNIYEETWTDKEFYPNYRYYGENITWEEAMEYEQYSINRFNKIYNASLVLPTCQKEGSVTFTCSVCGATETYKIEKDPNMHTLSDWAPVKGAEATCEKAGLEARYCVDPGHGDHAPAFTRNAAALGHDWKYVKVKEYDGCVPKLINVVCSRCGKTQDITYDQVGTGNFKKINKEKIPTKHAFEEIAKYFEKEVPALELESKNYKFSGTGEKAKLVPSLCTEDAVFVFRCKNWNDKHDANDINAYKVVERKATDHTYGAWTTFTAATEEKAGFYTRKCTVCGHPQNKTGWLVDGEVVDKNGNTTTPIALAVDLTEVKDGEGIATVKLTSGELAKDSKLYARIAWFYTTDDGLTYGFTAVKAVETDEDGNMTIDVSGPNPGDGFNLTGGSVVLTTDKNAHKTGAWREKALTDGDEF